MSLVNDMLRDLDRRRKDSTGSGASVALTPAPEAPRTSNRRSVLIYVIVALVVGAGAIAWFWQQQQNGATTRQLEIGPRVVTQPETNIPAPILEESGQAEPTISEQALALEVETTEAPDRATALPSERVVAAVESEQGSGVQTAVAVQPVQDSRLIENARPAESPDGNPTVASAAIEEPAQPTANDTIDLTQAVSEDVKNAARLTPEESDLRAVQEALRLIANNDTTSAYVLLEQQIIDNRYAHQSRETYAKLLMNEGNQLAALELTDAGLALSPNHPGFKKVKARLLIAQGKIDEAVNLLLTRAPEVSEDVEYHDILATAQLASRDYEGALISYSGLVQTDQSQGKWWYGFAASQESLGNANAARQGYTQAMRFSNLSANLRRRSQERLELLSQ